MIKGIFICETLNNCLELKKNSKKKIILITSCVLGYYILQTGDYREYLYRQLYTLGMFFLFANSKREQKEKNIIAIALVFSIYEVISTFNSVIAVIFISFLPFEFGKEKIEMMMISAVLLIILLFMGFQVIKSVKFNWDNIQKAKYLIYVLYLSILSIKIPFLYTEIRDGYTLKLVFLAIICCSTIFIIISLIERRKAAKEKERVVENNKVLAARLHKSQEILPAMVQALNDVTEKNGSIMEAGKAHKLLEEVSSLYSQQLEENKKEDLQLKNFRSTGLTLLDRQLNIYQSEAIDKAYHMDIFVQAPIDDIIRQMKIEQLKLQRAIGDLVRNAFHAIGKTQGKGGHILLIIGCQENETLEIAVMDDGVDIPLPVLKEFGKRGLTTGGTGNGLADLKEFMQGVNASIHIEEFEKEDLFTKKIAIIFDGLGRYYLNSPRKDDIDGFIWYN